MRPPLNLTAAAASLVVVCGLRLYRHPALQASEARLASLMALVDDVDLAPISVEPKALGNKRDRKLHPRRRRALFGLQAFSSDKPPWVQSGSPAKVRSVFSARSR